MRRAGTAVALDVVGSAAVLVLLGVAWQRASVVRVAPFGPVGADLSGRSVVPAAFALAVVTLAGAVAALATRGLARRVVGGLVVLAALGTAALALSGAAAVGDGRARALVASAVADQGGGGAVIPLRDGTVSVTVHAVWPVLAAVAALLPVVAGVLWSLPTTERGGLGQRYEAPVASGRPRDATWWSALDHGDDPTAADAVDAVDAVDAPGVPDLPPTPGEPDVDRTPGPRTV